MFILRKLLNSRSNWLQFALLTVEMFISFQTLVKIFSFSCSSQVWTYPEILCKMYPFYLVENTLLIFPYGKTREFSHEINIFFFLTICSHFLLRRRGNFHTDPYTMLAVAQTYFYCFCCAYILRNNKDCINK